jgi:hypothetical protein
LLLQPTVAGAPYDPARVDEALAARGVTQTPKGRVWKLKAGEIEVRLLVEGGVALATELRVPLSDKLELIREAVVQGAALAAEAQVRLLDPHLSKELSERDDALVADEFLRTASYAGRMMGVSEALGASYTGEDPTALKPGTKVLLGLGALLVLLYLVADKLLG